MFSESLEKSSSIRLLGHWSVFQTEVLAILAAAETIQSTHVSNGKAAIKALGSEISNSKTV